MTELEAVGEILESIQEPAPASLPGSDDGSDEWQALVVLRRERERALLQKWHLNTYKDQAFTPDGSDQIALTGALAIEKSCKSAALSYTMRDGMLYDLENGVDTWANQDTVYVTVIYDVAFDELPESLAAYIVKRASVQFQRRKKRGRTDDAMLQQELREAMNAARVDDSRQRRTNYLHSDHAIQTKGGLRHPIQRSPIFRG